RAPAGWRAVNPNELYVIGWPPVRADRRRRARLDRHQSRRLCHGVDAASLGQGATPQLFIGHQGFLAALAGLLVRPRLATGLDASGLAARLTSSAMRAALRRSVLVSRSMASLSIMARAALVVASCRLSIEVGFGLNTPSGRGGLRIRISLKKQKRPEHPRPFSSAPTASARTSVVKGRTPFSLARLPADFLPRSCRCDYPCRCRSSLSDPRRGYAFRRARQRRYGRTRPAAHCPVR